MANDLIALLWHTTVAASLAAIVVMAVRVPLRRFCGCGVAYAAWLAVPLTVVATMLPAPAFHVPTLGVPFVMHPGFDTTPRIVTQVRTWTWQHGAALVWLLGAMGMARRQIDAQRAYLRSLGPLTVEGGLATSRSTAMGPSLIGLWNPVIALPADFAERYTSAERELIVAHERAHAAARDRWSTCCARHRSACGGSTR